MPATPYHRNPNIHHRIRHKQQQPGRKFHRRGNLLPPFRKEDRHKPHGTNHGEHLTGIATEDQKLDLATGDEEDDRAEGRTAAVSTRDRLKTARGEVKKAKVPRSCHAGADAGCAAITTGKELEALYKPPWCAAAMDAEATVMDASFAVEDAEAAPMDAEATNEDSDAPKEDY
jgi:hypothetical protein